MPKRPRLGAQPPPVPCDEDLAIVFREFLPSAQPGGPTRLSPGALCQAIRQTIEFSRTLASDKKHISRASAEVSRIFEAAKELRNAVNQADPHTIRLLLGGQSLDGRRMAMVAIDPRSKGPAPNPKDPPQYRMESPIADCLKALDELEPAAMLAAKFLQKESTGGPRTLLSLLLGTRNYHFALQSRVLLAALGWPNEAKSSRKVCKMTAAFIGLVGEAVTDAGTQQYAKASFMVVQADPEGFEEAYLRLLERDLASRSPEEGSELARIRARLTGMPTNAARALMESMGS